MAMKSCAFVHRYFQQKLHLCMLKLCLHYLAPLTRYSTPLPNLLWQVRRLFSKKRMIAVHQGAALLTQFLQRKKAQT